MFAQTQLKMSPFGKFTRCEGEAEKYKQIDVFQDTGIPDVFAIIK